jgi:nitrate reductase NapD
MQYSGIVVVTRPQDAPGVLSRLRSLPAIALCLEPAANGRIVVVQEAADVPAHEAGFRAIQALPGVLAAELFYHVTDLEAPSDLRVESHPAAGAGPS